MKKYTTKEFIKKCKELGHDKYDYSQCNYINNNCQIIIGCPKHGFVSTYASKLLKTENKNKECCPQCQKENTNHSAYKYNKEEVLQIFNQLQKQNNNLDFSHTLDNINLDNGVHQIVYVNCLKHGIQRVWLYQLLSKQWNCKKCNKENKHNLLAKENYEYWIDKFKLEQPGYDYSITKPTISKYYDRYDIICPEHGIQHIVANTFIKNGCPKCNNGSGRILRNYTNDEYINELKKIHGNKYDYSLVNYQGPKIKVKLICPKHGEFLREPIRLINNEHKGCPYCKESFLEQEVRKYLQDHNINFISQYTINKKRLDFYLIDYNCGIECQGRQHFFLNSKYNFNIQTIDELYNYDKNKQELFQNNGIKIFYYTNIKIKTNYFDKLYYDIDKLINDIKKYGTKRSL